jgi:hypothetical protein
MSELKARPIRAITMADPDSVYQKKMDELDLLLAGMPVQIVLDILGSFIAIQVTEMQENDIAAACEFINTFASGMKNIAAVIIKSQAN